jgi:hypothetical protein
VFADCMFCHRPFGANGVLESFPVGRRLAFDSARGRLWVVCKRCDRWNLSPIEERWEAVEDCERLFESTRLKVSTENIGLARHREGLELVRIGRPQRPEFAAWRYGDQFGRRRKRAIVYGVAGAGVLGAVAVGGAMAGVAVGPFLAQSGNLVRLFQYGRKPLTLQTADGELIKLNHAELYNARIVRDAESWSISIKHGRAFKHRVHSFGGAEAERVAGLLLTRINHTGGSRATVQSAVQMIEQSGHPEAFVEAAVHRLRFGQMGGKNGQLAKLPAPTRLALEMALHEERERRSLEGELKGLEIIWRREEEIAQISDDLLLPDTARGRLETLRGSLDVESRSDHPNG